MSKYNVGDEFKIVIDEVFKGAVSGNDKYRVRGFDGLVFDDKGLDKLIPILVKKQHYVFIYSVKYENEKWTGEEYDYGVKVQGQETEMTWMLIFGGHSIVGATVAITAVSKWDADRMLEEEIERRNKEISESTGDV